MIGVRTAWTVAGAAALIDFTFVGVAMAADAGPMPTLSNTGVAFDGGNYRFYYNECCRDFAATGNLRDTARDGNAVFVHARVAGYAYSGRVCNRAGAGMYLYTRLERDDYQATYVNTADVQACQDRGTLAADICAQARLTR